MDVAKLRWDIQGLKPARNIPAISNILFADETMLFGRAQVREAQAIRDTLSLYLAAMGQQIPIIFLYNFQSLQFKNRLERKLNHFLI